MPKIIYDVIQRFEVENGVPRLVSTNIQVIQGGEDLMSLATSLLAQLGFYEKFIESRTSQYIGYRLKNPGKGAKRYQLVLAQRKESLYVSINKTVIEPHLQTILTSSSEEKKIWVRPSKLNDFQKNIEKFQKSKGENSCFFFIDAFSKVEDSREKKIKPVKFFNYFPSIGACYLEVITDSLFPYNWQVSIDSVEILEEFIDDFAKILMEQE